MVIEMKTTNVIYASKQDIQKLIVIYKAFWFDVAQDYINGVPKWDSNSLVKVC